MPSVYRDRLIHLLADIRQVFYSEFHLQNPYRYDDIEGGEKLGMIAFEELGSDSRLQAADIFKQITTDIIISGGFLSEAEAEAYAMSCVLDLDNFTGILQRALPTHHDLFYRFELEGRISRSLRQLINHPEVWIADIVATGAVRIVLPKTAAGEHRD